MGEKRGSYVREGFNIKKKEILDKVFYLYGKQKYDFWVCGTYGERKFTKWKKYFEAVANIDNNSSWEEISYFNSINQRQILPNEVVLDIEEREKIGDIISKLLLGGYEFKIFNTGSRGFHIHLFFGNEEFNEEEKRAIISYFGTDIQKSNDKNLIALEGCPHWKTGRNKVEVVL